nr:uncharacterized mitochondrial protein AtMg00810-like [Tanacetum cinerariifolium]
MGELSFFLRLQVQQKSDGIFISQDKYVADILKKFNFFTVKTTSTLMEPNKPLVKDAEAEDVDVHLYRLMIRSLMYLTASRPDITFAVCACARFQFTPKTSHLHVVKRIFRYLKGQPKLGLWYPRDSPFNLEAYSDSDYAGASLDRKSTTGGCQFLGKRLISWQCKKQTIVVNSTIEAEYVAAAKKPSEFEGFEQIIDFLNAKPIRYALTVNPIVYALRVKQFWTTAKVKKVNGQEQIQAIVDKHKVIITEESIKCNLQFDDAEGTACLPNDTIFEELARMGAKTTTWNELSSTMASVIICLANNQKFNFSKYIFNHMVKHLEGGVKFLIFLRFLQVFLDKQIEGMAKHKECCRRHGQGFSRNVTPLFETMMVTAQEERQATEVHSPSCEILVEESIPTPSNDPIPSGEDSIQLNELMILCTNLQQQVLDLEEAKIAQAKKIAKLKKRVKKLEKRKKSRSARLRRLKKAGSSKQVESFEEKDSLGAQEDASKQGRSIEDIDQNAEIALVYEAQGRMNDAYMFGVDDLEGNEVFVDVREKTIKKKVSTADLVTTAGEVVTAASVKDSAVPTTATTADVDD